MEDYKLSEVKAICENHNGDCSKCEIADFSWFYNDWKCPLALKPFCLRIDEEAKDDKRKDN